MKSMNAAKNITCQGIYAGHKSIKAQALNITLQPAEYTNSQEVAVLGLDVSIAVLISMMKQRKCFTYSNVPQIGTHSSH